MKSVKENMNIFYLYLAIYQVKIGYKMSGQENVELHISKSNNLCHYFANPKTDEKLSFLLLMCRGRN